MGERRRDRRPHPSHRMTKWGIEVLAPVGTPRFYRTRKCARCDGEEMRHPAGHFLGNLERKCPVPKRARASVSGGEKGGGRGE